MRQAGHAIGGVLAACVNMLNPAVIVLGGDVAGAGEPLLAAIREVVYRRSLPLATGRLRIVPSQLGDEAGIMGAAVMVLETILAPAAIDAALVGAGRRPDRRRRGGQVGGLVSGVASSPGCQRPERSSCGQDGVAKRSRLAEPRSGSSPPISGWSPISASGTGLR